MATTLRAFLAASLLAVSAGVSGAPASGDDTVRRTFVFETDRWLDLDDAGYGPIKLHRLQIARQGSPKSPIMRPGNAEFLTNLEIKLEYSNPSHNDWLADMHVAMLDEAGLEIDGYDGKQELEPEEGHAVTTAKISANKYGLERARKLRVVIEVRRD